LFKINNFRFGWKGDSNGFVKQLRGTQTMGEREDR